MGVASDAAGKEALKSLDGVENVKADVSASSFDITFKTGSIVDFDLLKKNQIMKKL